LLAEVLYTAPPVPCIGLDADECCTTVLNTVSAAGIPLVGDNGNCVSWWVHQEPLEPIISEESGELAYIEHAQGISGTCEAIELTPVQVADADTAAMAAIATSVTAIEAILDAGSVTCSGFIDLQLELLLVGRAKPGAIMSKIAGLLCGVCSDPDTSYTITPDMTFALEFIIEFLTKETTDSTDNCIIIYVDHQGLVMEPPKIGGSRSELDWDRDDPDCDEDCEAPKIYDAISKTCVCTGEFMDDSSNPGECTCTGDRTFDEQTGTCNCPAEQEFDYVSGECVCTLPKVNDPNGDCVCPAPVFVEIQGTCECKDEQAMLSADGLICECQGGYVDDGMGGCVCGNPAGCGGTNDCPYPKMQNAAGECVCVSQFEGDGMADVNALLR
jgi:hypothetical protein